MHKMPEVSVSDGLKLLIITQAVDLDEPVLAFFHGWIVEFAKHCEHVRVVCLKKGRYALPANVSVYSLGKESGASRIRYIRNFYRYIWNLRKEYDAVFVHMNPEYVVLAGWFWRVLSKRIGLWYIHPQASFSVRIALLFVHRVMSATEKSFPLHTAKLAALGIGVDTGFFSPSLAKIQGAQKLRVMQVARLAPVKRVACVINAVSDVTARGIPITCDQYGSSLPRDARYAADMRKLAATIPQGVWTFRGDVTQEQVRDAYRSHDVHVNATDSGSFDKAVFESMACGCITIASNRALAGVLPEELQFVEGDSHSLADVLMHVNKMSRDERAALSVRIRRLMAEKYSLAVLIGRIVATLS